jgi:hypothetical protein
MPFVNVKQSSSIYIGEYPFHQQLKDDLVPLLEDYPDIQKKETNVKATMTEWFWQHDNSKVKNLKRYFITLVYNKFQYGDIGCVKSFLVFKEFWANVYRKGEYTDSHSHRTNWFSIVYFLKSKWYYPPLVFTNTRQKIRPKEGTYVIFPSYLKHHVPKHQYNDTRMTLSGNLDLKEEES